MAGFRFQELFELGEDTTPYRRLGGDFVRVVREGGREILKVEREALVQLATAAFDDVAHLLRPGHLAQLRRSSTIRRRPPTTASSLSSC